MLTIPTYPSTILRSPLPLVVAAVLLWTGIYCSDIVFWPSLFLQPDPLPFPISLSQPFGGFSRIVSPFFPPVGSDPLLVMRRAHSCIRSRGWLRWFARRRPTLSHASYSAYTILWWIPELTSPVRPPSPLLDSRSFTGCGVCFRMSVVEYIKNMVAHDRAIQPC